MPTGYTDSIKDDISFQQFAIRCARAFGVTVTMREDSLDEPIPEKFEPSSWNQNELKKSLAELKRLEALSLEDAAREAYAEYVKEKEYEEEEITKSKNVVEKYRDMLVKVHQWQPPTLDHVELKTFMIEQLVSSMQYDNKEDYYLYKEHIAVLLSPAVWLEKKKASAKWNIDYHTKEDKKEQDRVAKRNAWIRALRESLLDDNIIHTTVEIQEK